MATLLRAVSRTCRVTDACRLYGLNAYTVTRRTNEIGYASHSAPAVSAIARSIVAETGVVLASGAVIGTVLALASASAAATLLFGVRP